MSAYKHHKITIDYAKDQIKYWQQIISTLEKCTYLPSDPVPTQIFKLYANLQSVTEVAKSLKSNGIINPDTNKPYTSTEITHFIKSTSIEDKDIESLVKELQKNNKNISKKLHH